MCLLIYTKAINTAVSAFLENRTQVGDKNYVYVFVVGGGLAGAHYSLYSVNQTKGAGDV